jgi:hypothetical protein
MGEALLVSGVLGFLCGCTSGPQTQAPSTHCTVQLPGGDVVLDLIGPKATSYCAQLVSDVHVGWTYTTKRGKPGCSFHLDGAMGTFLADNAVPHPDQLCRGWGPGIPNSA